MTQKFAIATQNQARKISAFNDYQNSGSFYNGDEYHAFVGDVQVSLGISCSAKWHNQIYQLRETVYQDKMSYLLNAESGLPTSADKLDAASYIFYCRQGDRIIASCRYTPSINGKWESPEITDAANLVPAEPTQMLQIGRLLVAPEYRSQLISEALVWAASDWLEQNTQYKSFYAICTSALVRFYRHFGAKSVAKTQITLPERQNKTYRIVYGSMKTVAETLEQYIRKRDGNLIYPLQNKATKIVSQYL